MVGIRNDCRSTHPKSPSFSALGRTISTVIKSRRRQVTFLFLFFSFSLVTVTKLIVAKSRIHCLAKEISFHQKEKRKRDIRLQQVTFSARMAPDSSAPPDDGKSNCKSVWLWTQQKEVMTAAVERGWTTFLFSQNSRHLATEWSSIARITPLFVKDGDLIDQESTRIAKFSEISSPQELDQLLHLTDNLSENMVIDLVDWQIIPAENIVAAFQSSEKTVFAISRSASEARNFLEALEQGLGGVVLKVEDVAAILDLKEYFDRRDEVSNRLKLVTATITQVRVAGMGDRVCVDLCSLMKPGEGLLVGSFARGLFLVHSECLESNYIASRPFRVNAGPVHSYIAVPGGKTCYLSELEAGKEVIVVDQNGHQRTAIVGRSKIETRPLLLVEAKMDSSDQIPYSALLQNAETVALVAPSIGSRCESTAIPVTALKAGDEVLLRLQGEARHTGIEIQEFIVEK